MKNCYESSLFDLNDYRSQDDYYVKKKKKCEVEKVQKCGKNGETKDTELVVFNFVWQSYYNVMR